MSTDAMHDDPAVIYKRCAEMVEMEYLRAVERGAADPVIELMAMDPAKPNTVSVALWERPKLVEALKAFSVKAAEKLAARSPARHYPVVVALNRGVTVFQREAVGEIQKAKQSAAARRAVSTRARNRRQAAAEESRQRYVAGGGVGESSCHIGTFYRTGPMAQTLPEIVAEITQGYADPDTGERFMVEGLNDWDEATDVVVWRSGKVRAIIRRLPDGQFESQLFDDTDD